MISEQEEQYILNRAYVPEHIVSLMRLISGGEAFLQDDYLFFAKNRLLMFIGFPLSKDFREDEFIDLLEHATQRLKAEHRRFIAPVIPGSLVKSCMCTQQDHYYRLDVKTVSIKRDLERTCEKASEILSVTRENRLGEDHKVLIKEFIERVNPSEQVKALYMNMEGYVATSQTACVLNANDRNGNLAAFYIIDTAARDFMTYLVGCHSKRHYVAHASDLLMGQVIRLCSEYNKKYINLGLGVNEGIRSFKKKWGGYPFLTYAYCESEEGSRARHGFMDYLRSKL